MAEVGVISVRITADDREFRRAFQRSRGSIRELAQRFRTAADRAAKYTAAITAVAVAVGTRLVNAQIKAVDQLQKTSQLLGIQTDRLAGLQFAAEQTGVSTQNLNMGLQRMVRRIAEAAQGSGEAQGAIKDLGLEAKSLAELSPDEQFRRIAEAMQGVEGQSQRVRIAFKLFDSEGAKLLNTLSAGEQGLDRFQRTAEELGVAVSEVESQQIVAAADAVNRAQTAFSGIVRTATIELAPIISELSDRFVDASREAGGFRAEILGSMEAIATTTAHVNNGIRGIGIAFKGVQVAFEGVNFVITKGLADLVATNREVTNAIIGGINQVIEAWNALGIAQMDTIGQLPVGQFERDMAGMAESSRRNIQQLTEEMHRLAMEGANPEQIREFFKTLREESRRAAEEAGGAIAGGGGEGEDGEGGLGRAEREKQEARLQAIRESLMTERELQLEQFELQREQLRTALENELITRKEFNELNRDLESQHWERMKGIRKDAMSDLEKFTSASFASQTKTVASELARMTATVADENKTMFQINKVAAIADAIVSAHQGISRTLSAYPYPLNIGMAAAHAAVAFAQVSKIRSQSFGGGGGTTAPSVAASTPAGATPTSDAGGGGQQGPAREATFNISGDTFGPEAIEKIAESLNEFAGDNGDLRVNVRRAA